MIWIRFNRDNDPDLIVFFKSRFLVHLLGETPINHYNKLSQQGLDLAYTVSAALQIAERRRGALKALE